jgi:hypothetical protein
LIRTLQSLQTHYCEPYFSTTQRLVPRTLGVFPTA